MSAIFPLPAEAVAQIKSSSTITSLNDVIIELVKNSLDASSSKLDIEVNYARGNCTVVDNGLGISPFDFRADGGLGKFHHTSKRGKNHTYGSRGSYLAHLGSLSILTITSRHLAHHSQNSLTISKSGVVIRQTPASNLHHLPGVGQGTRIAVRDLFGNIAVRVKQRAIHATDNSAFEKNWDELRRNTVSLILAWKSSLAICLRDILSGRKLLVKAPSQNNSPEATRFDEEFVMRVLKILSQTDYIHNLQTSAWVYVTASNHILSIRGAISLEPAPTKRVQFISLGIFPVERHIGHNILYDDINKLFSNSSFGCETGDAASNSLGPIDSAQHLHSIGHKLHVKAPKERGKGIDRWPMFYFRVETDDTTCNANSADFPGDKVQAQLGLISQLLHLMIFEFLTRHQFSPRNLQSKTPVVKLPMPELLSKDAAPFALDSSSTVRANSAGDGAIHRQSSPSSRSNRTMDLTILSADKTLQIRSRSASPFSQWSRIKSGRQPSNLKWKNAHSKLRDSYEIPGKVAEHQENDNNLSIMDASSELESKFQKSRQFGDQSDQKARSILSKSGEVVRRPFDLVLADVKKEPRLLFSDSVSDSISLDTNAASLSWNDPTTMETFNVDPRTGHASRPQISPLNDLSSELGKPRKRLLAHKSGIKGQQTTPWIEELLEVWANPVFQPTEAAVPGISMRQVSHGDEHMPHHVQHHCTTLNPDQLFKESSAGFSGRLSKSSLMDAKIISQLDDKFILVKMVCSEPLYELTSNAPNHALAVIDQHAADERCRIEALLSQFWDESGAVVSNHLHKPIKFEISRPEMEMLVEHASYFEKWGILYKFSKPGKDITQEMERKVTVLALPSGIIERCTSEPKLLIELIRSEVWKCHERQSSRGSKEQVQDDTPVAERRDTSSGPHSWLKETHDMPVGILNMLNSRACRSAVMFNDKLSMSQAHDLASKLSECAFPFQCAHGRPSMIPLVDLGSLQGPGSTIISEKPLSFGAAFRSWKKENM